MTTIAQEICGRFTKGQAVYIANPDGFVKACDDLSVDADQDWGGGSTTYIFEDGSKILYAGSFAEAKDPTNDQ